MKNTRLFHGNEAGFTLIEALIAMVVLTIGVFALYSMQIIAIQGNAHSNSISLASNIAAEQVEDIISLNYIDEGKLRDVNGDGTKQDLNDDGVDDDGGNFGLDNVDGTADYTIAPPNATYTVFYNVVEEVPMRDTKMVRVIVRDNSRSMNNTVSFQYIKNDNI